MAQEAGKIVDVDRLTIWVLADNFYDVAVLDTKISKRYRGGPGGSIHAEHGLSYYMEESVVDGKTNAFMFDYGADPAGVMNNVVLLAWIPERQKHSR